MKKLFFAIALCLLSVSIFAQSVETGYVKEYNGEKAKTPLAGVELNVNGAPSTVSDADGRYELRFAVQKPGETVKCNEIYKSGYVIFNKDALDFWRISNSKKPFVIVMCKESAFRELKKKFYGIIEKSYREEYEKQVAIAQKTARNAANLQTQIKKLKEEYEEKLSNINTYVELFARIDRSEMDSIVGRALSLIEEGKIDEGIKVYEELKLTQQVEQQLDKWNSGESMRQAAEMMIGDSQRDLVVLTEKLQQQIGLYEMGGSDYTEKRKEMMVSLIKVFRRLNNAFEGRYNEELGTWICNLADLSKPWEDRLNDYREAADLPSWHGQVKLAYYYEFHAYNNPQLVDSTRIYYQKALQFASSDSIRKPIERTNLFFCADFYSVNTQGDTLYYKHFGGTDSVYVWPKTRACYNKVAGSLNIPEIVVHDGITYTVAGVGPYAFFKNRHLKHVSLPSHIKRIYNNAFDKCDSLDIMIINDRLQEVLSEAIPPATSLILPNKMKEFEWIDNLINERFDIIGKNSSQSYYLPMRNLLSTLTKNKHVTKEKKALYTACVGLLDFQYGDTISALKYLLEAKEHTDAFDREIGRIYYDRGDFQKAYHYYSNAAINNAIAYNDLAYMFARGEYVEKDYKKALEHIDMAISANPDNANFYDTKGEIYLMMGQRDSALVYWNRVLEQDPDFTANRSALYKGLFPEKTDGQDKEEQLRLRTQDYINIVQLAAKYEYEQQYDAFDEIEYEEMVSIGILGIQAFFKNKTIEQLDNYNPAYIGTAVRWAIRNECRIRYDWYWPIYYRDFEMSNEEHDVYTKDGHKIDWEKYKVQLTVYRTIWTMYKDLLSKADKKESLSKSEEMILKMGELIKKALAFHDLQRRQAICDIINGKGITDVAKDNDMSFDEVVIHTRNFFYAMKEVFKEKGLHN